VIHDAGRRHRFCLPLGDLGELWVGFDRRKAVLGLYCEIIAAISSACASVAITTKPITKQMAFIAAFPLAHKALAPARHRIISFPPGWGFLDRRRQ